MMPTLDELAAEVYSIRATMEERDRRMEDRYKNQNESVAKAEKRLREQQEAANEWRGAMNDLSSRLLPRNEYETRHRDLVTRVDTISIRIASIEGRSTGVGVSAAIVVSGLAALIALGDLITKLITH